MQDVKLCIELVKWTNRLIKFIIENRYLHSNGYVERFPESSLSVPGRKVSDINRKSVRTKSWCSYYLRICYPRDPTAMRIERFEVNALYSIIP